MAGSGGSSEAEVTTTLHASHDVLLLIERLRRFGGLGHGTFRLVLLVVVLVLIIVAALVQRRR